MGNLTSCMSKQVEKEGRDLILALFSDMEKRLMDCIKAELSQSRSQASTASGGDVELPPPPRLTRQESQML